MPRRYKINRMRRRPSVATEMDYIVDVQGFKRPLNDFVVKELAIVSLNIDEPPTSFLFKPPCGWNFLPARYKSENSWLQRVFHGLSWNSGDIPYGEVKTILETALKYARAVYVKGVLKKEWLQRLLPGLNVIEMEESLECSSLHQLQRYPMIKCEHHAIRNNCAVNNVTLLKKWYCQAHQNIPSLQRSLKIFMEMGHLSAMNIEDIACLSKDFILAFASSHIEAAWEKLPAVMKMDPDIWECRRCAIHYETNGDDVFDGPTPMIKDCKICQRYY